MQEGGNAPDDAARLTQVRALVDAARRQAADLSLPGCHITAKVHDNPNFLTGYSITEIIHRGGQGVVYRARQHSTGRNVAVKIMHEGPFGGPKEYARFEREVQILGQLVHPNIVGILDSGTVSGSPYFIMDHILGVPLDQWVQDGHNRCNPRDSADSLIRSAERKSQSFIDETLRLFAKICDAVHAAHLRGIIHRDLKPNNILIDMNGEPHILDFGLAKFDADGHAGSAASVTTTGHFVGSLPWASPEQAAGDVGRIDIRTDVYSIGVMLYQTLAGRFPYSVACGIRDALDRIVNTQPARPSSVARGLNDELDTIVLKCLSKDPERRYDSAGELARDIRHYLSNEPIEAKGDSTWYVVRKTIRRHRVIVGSLLVLVLIILGSTVLALSLMLQAQRSEQKAQWNLRDSLVAQARSRRQIITIGRRSESLATLSKAAAIRPGVDLRNEVIATLAVPDLSPQLVPAPPGSRAVAVSSDLARFAHLLPDGGVSIVGGNDGAEIARIPPPTLPGEAMGRWYCSNSFFIRSFRHMDQLQQIEVWQLPEATLHLTITDIPREDEYDVAPDGRTLAVGHSDHAIHVYDLVMGRETRQIPLDRNAARLRFDPSGKRLLRYQDRDSEASVLDLETGRWSQLMGLHEISHAAAWSLDGRLLAGAQDDLIHLWDVRENRQLAVLRGHDSRVVQFSFSNDSRLLASYGWEGSSLLWNLTTLRPILRADMHNLTFASDDRTIGGIAQQDGVSRIFRCQFLFQDVYRTIGAEFGTDRLKAYGGAVHPSGRIAVAAFIDREEKIQGMEWFDIARHCVIGRMEYASLDMVRFDPSGSFLYATGSKGLLRWPVRIDEATIQLGPAEQLLADFQAEQFDLTADGGRLVVVSWGKGTLTVINTQHPDQQVSYPCLPKGLNVSISPDGKWAVVTTWHGSGGEVWDLESGSLISRLDLAAAAMPKFSPDGRWLTIRDWGHLIFVQPGTWQETRRSKVTFGGRVGFSHDGRIALTADNRNIIHLIDTKTFEELALLEPPDLLAVADTPSFVDASTLGVFTGPGALLQLWDLRRIRATLASMNLDWDHPPIPPAADNSIPGPLELELELGANVLENSFP